MDSVGGEAPSSIRCSTSGGERATLALKLFRENEISPGLIGLSPLSAGHRRRFQPTCVRPSTGLTPASACPWIAHPASRPRRGTEVALFRLAFAAAPFCLTSPRASDSQAHSTKGTPSQRKKLLRLLVGARFQVLFHSPLGVLFTFPSRYWCAIGHRVVLRLGWWSTQVRTGFHVPGPTQGTASRRPVWVRVRGCHPLRPAIPCRSAPPAGPAPGGGSPGCAALQPSAEPPAGYARSTVWPSVPFRSPLLGESRD